jgi:hypothetical protein
VLIECAAQAKGKEFGHVILPYLQADEFPTRASRAPMKKTCSMWPPPVHASA